MESSDIFTSIIIEPSDKGIRKNWRQSRWNFSEKPDTHFFDHKRNNTILEELKTEPADEKLRRYKLNWPQLEIKMNKRMPKTLLIYRQNEFSRLGRPLKELIGEADTGLISPNY